MKALFASRRLNISRPRLADSGGDVPIDKELAALFRGWHAKATGAFVIEADGEPLSGTSYLYYRAQAFRCPDRLAAREGRVGYQTTP